MYDYTSYEKADQEQSSQVAAPTYDAAISPELSEFMHMLEAIEDHSPVKTDADSKR